MSEPALTIDAPRRTTRSFRLPQGLDAFDTPPLSTTRLLLVDDEDAVRSALGRYLSGVGFDVDVADSAAAALERLRERRYALMLTDVRMPGMTGIELVPRARDLDDDLAVVMLTAVNDAPTATGALNGGALDYLTKPIELSALRDAVDRALHRRQLLIHQRTVERRIREEVALRTSELEREQAAMRDLTLHVADSLIKAMEAKDVYLRGHAQRVSALAAGVAEQLGLPETTVEQVRLAGRLHDVGKIGIRESILNKPGALTAEEFEHVKSHVEIGLEILAPLKHLGDVLLFVRDHHEHWDGTGYPRGLRGEQISIGGRILVAADAFDALISQRAYRDAISAEEAIEYLERHSGYLIDPTVYQAMRAKVLGRRTLTFIE